MSLVQSSEHDLKRPEVFSQNGNYAPVWEDPSVNEQNTAVGIDYVGIALRRKWILILFALIGAGIGYLVYLKTPTTYKSALRLMIWTQSPPITVNGDTLTQKVSLPKHQSLIVSDLVLSNAVKNGQLDKLVTMKDMSPIGYLKQNVGVESVGDAADALDLSVTGPISEDLPKMLEQIVAAYEDVIARDTVSVGKDSVVVMETMHAKLEAEKNVAEERYFELFKKLGLTQANQGNEISNPYNDEISMLNKKLQESKDELEDVTGRLKSLADFASLPEKTDEQLKVLAVEARRYMQLPVERLQSNATKQSEAFRELPLEMQRSYQKLTREVEELDSNIQDREMERSKYVRMYGARHFQMRAIDADLKALKEQFELRQEELKKLTAEAEQLIGSSLGGVVLSVEELARKSEQETISLYSLALARDRDQLTESIKSVSERLSSAESMAASISADLTELNILKNQIDEKRQSIREILDRLAEMNVLAGNYTYTKVRVIDPPGNGYPVAPNLLQYLGIGIVACSIIGFGLAFLVDWSDQSYRNPQEIATVLRTPVLGKVPIIRDAKRNKNRAASLITIHRTNSVAAEAFRSIRTSLAFVAGKSSGKVFVITSASPGDGKSTVAANLAVSLAHMGKKVVLVDGDFRRPRVHQVFDCDIGPGSLQHFEEGVPLVEVTRVIENVPNLSILTVGGYPKNPGELVSSARFEDLLISLRREFDFVLIDTPPVLPVADALGMSAFVDGVVMVMRIRRGVIVASQKAKEQLDMVDARLVGVVVNGVDNNPYYSDYGRYGFRYGYGFSYGNNVGYGRYYDSMKANYYDKVEEES